MSSKKISILGKQSAIAGGILALALLSSCSGKKNLQPDSLQPTSDAALLDSAEKDSGASDKAFADIKDPDANPLATPETAAAATAATADNGPFYDPVGGESIGRVAYTLYGKRTFAKNLLEKNPTLGDGKSLTTEQKVFFDFDGVSPQPTYLTKGLINRYADQLAEKLSAKESNKGHSTATVGKGETLQALSQRLYGTTRYWTEIYLLNRTKVASYDKVGAGIELEVVERSAAPAVAATSPETAPTAAAMEPSPAAAAVEEQPTPAEPLQQHLTPVASTQPTAAPVTTQAAVTPAPVAPHQDPIPETPTAVTTQTPPAPAPIVIPPPKPRPVMAEGSDFASSTNMRRMIYLALVISIAGIAFFLTRPSKKKKFDMLDVTSDSGPRPRVGGPKDSQKQSVG